MGIFFKNNPVSGYIGPNAIEEIDATGTQTLSGNELKIIDEDTPANNWVSWKGDDGTPTTDGAENWYFQIVSSQEVQTAQLRMSSDGRTIIKDNDAADWPSTLSVKAFNKKSGSFIVGPNGTEGYEDYLILY